MMEFDGLKYENDESEDWASSGEDRPSDEDDMPWHDETRELSKDFEREAVEMAG